jgi:transposase
MRAADADTPTLPEDPAALRALLLEALDKVDVLASRCGHVTAERDALVEQNERLRHLLLKLQRRQFGRRSERLTDEQLQFAFEEIEATLAENAAAPVAAACPGIYRRSSRCWRRRRPPAPAARAR